MIVSLAYVGLEADTLRQILETLDGEGWKATFFVDPPSVLNDVAIWHSLAKAGHEIGNAALQGVTLSGELLNWTVRMVEQDLHMTQSFLEDEFAEHAVPVFVYPGPFTRCSDGDYRAVIDQQFDVAVTPGGMEGKLAERMRQRVSMEELSDTEPWTILRPPETPDEQSEFVARIKANPNFEVLPIYAAAARFGLAR